VKLKDGSALVANTAYIRESIAAPNAKVVAGYPLAMPSYGEDLTATELDALVEHVRRLQAVPGLAAKPKTSAPDVPAAKAAESAEPAEANGEAPKATSEPAQVVVDPVCSMTVRVTETTPRTTYAGHTVYFCSATCRDKFLAEPARYTQAPTP
jgi:YHS domain-containing protein